MSIFNVDIGGIMGGVGTLAKDIRTAITGKEPISQEKAAEIALKVQELESSIENAKISVVLAESQSQDKWTSRGRPTFLYVMYVMILSAIPMGVVYAVSPETASAVATGFGEWLRAIPNELYALFGAGYLGYGAFRTYDKKTGAVK